MKGRIEFRIHTHTHISYSQNSRFTKKLKLGIHITLPQKKIKQKITLLLLKD